MYSPKCIVRIWQHLQIGASREGCLLHARWLRDCTVFDFIKGLVGAAVIECNLWQGTEQYVLSRIEQVKAEGMKHGIKLFDAGTDTRRAEFPEDKLIQSFYDRYPNVSKIFSTSATYFMLAFLALNCNDLDILKRALLEQKTSALPKFSLYET